MSSEYSDSEYFKSESEWDWYDDQDDEVYFVVNTVKE